MAQTTVLVTGGAGFIGSHLVDRLFADGFRVVVVDSLVTGRRDRVHTDASFHELDLRSPRLAALVRVEKPEVVFHLAAAASVVQSVCNPARDARANVMGSLNLLQFARWERRLQRRERGRHDGQRCLHDTSSRTPT